MIRVDNKPSPGARWTLAEFDERQSRPRMTTERRRHIFVENAGICCFCNIEIDAKRERFEIAHLDGWWMSGKDANPYLKPAHYRCHREETAKIDVPAIAKVKRQQDRDLGFKVCASRPIDGSRNSMWRKPMNGRPERRR